MKDYAWDKWLRHRCREVGWSMGSLTGQDYRALAAVAACWQLYFMGDHDAERAALESVRALLGGMQPSARPFAKELIAYAGDWGDRDRIWPLVEGARQ